jgi:hypothetical protein
MDAAVGAEVARDAEIVVFLRSLLEKGWMEVRDDEDEVRSRLAYFKLISPSRKGDRLHGNIHVPGASADAHRA